MTKAKVREKNLKERSTKNEKHIISIHKENLEISRFYENYLKNCTNNQQLRRSNRRK